MTTIDRARLKPAEVAMVEAAEKAPHEPQWQAENGCVYALEHYRWWRGKEEFTNRWYAGVQGNAASQTEKDAIAAHIAAANPTAVLALCATIAELREAGRTLIDALDEVGVYDRTADEQERVRRVGEAMAKLSAFAPRAGEGE